MITALRAVSVSLSLLQIGLATCLFVAWVKTPEATKDGMAGGWFFGLCLGFVAGALASRAVSDIFKVTQKARP